ncbi:tetratricopeptide repeat-containing sulfotransferase family protein [Arenimonas oryziterrae]|uniref:Uncharacterized protein n=1 Tax=Arenimonas oryziterrae DSM 21050 = YC6267 TaxID=1121015 RepID=A0A091ATK0_9GAMM|nr:tetratricopeptide repeat-containing sulfotransferase family protein [Arenimonas oryziterrae]KFN43503.1 hypothetical protein N789_09520 [Arenimonas oryziterrae DSM 21050 = YC6267]
MTDPLRDQHLARRLNRAEAYLAQRNPDAARIAYESILADAPRHPLARLRLASIAGSQGRYREATMHALSLAQTPPADPYLLALLVSLLHRQGESQAALRCLARPEFDAFPEIQGLEEMAGLAILLEDMDLALRFLDRAARLAPVTATAYYQRGTVHAFRGDIDEATLAYERCLATAPKFAQAHWSLSRLRQQRPGHDHVQRLQTALTQATQDEERIHLEFALFKELDDLGDHGRAWRALERGAELKRATLEHRAQDDAAAFARLHKLADAGFFSSDARPPPASADMGPQPIFIVGLPRTGTTLLERLLAGHSGVAAAGELVDFATQMRWCANRPARSYLDPALIAAMENVDFAELGDRYLQHARWRAGGRRWFTDKMPLNFVNIGFIHRALPQARIVHMVREPMDACFSNLKELFTRMYPYSYRLDDIADYYEHYRLLMAHWQRAMPGRILDVHYEQLVAEPEAVMRSVLAFCDLPWESACAGTEGSTGVVTTASSVQVREPVHQRAVSQWRNYAQPLAPLEARLRAGGWL